MKSLPMAETISLSKQMCFNVKRENYIKKSSNESVKAMVIAAYEANGDWRGLADSLGGVLKRNLSMCEAKGAKITFQEVTDLPK